MLGALGLAGAVWAMLVALERTGRDFYATGKSVVDRLDGMAAALRARDFRTVAAQYDAGFRGRPLGLLAPRLEDERDGVRRYSFVPPAEPAAPRRGPRGNPEQGWTRAAAALALPPVKASPAAAIHARTLRSALAPGARQAGPSRQARSLPAPPPDPFSPAAEWQSYLAGFDSIEELGLHLDRLEQWQGEELVATVRFELIGRRRGEARAGIDRAIFRLRLRRDGTALGISEQSLVSGERLVAARPQFADVSHAAGIDFKNRYYPPFLTQPLAFGMIRYGPGGITAVDYDNDGFYDLFIPDGVASKLLRNRGDGTFEDVTAKAGLAGLDGVSVALFADYDNDGYKDLFVSRTFRPNQLFHNNGDGTFTDVTARSGLGADCCTTVASWGDYDNDGWPDLLVANDFGRSTLYHNQRDGTFRDVTVAAHTLAYGAGMSANFGDFDNDGRLDIYTADIRSEHGWFAAPPTVGRYMANSFLQGVWRSDMPLYFQIFRQSGFDFVDVFREMASGNHLLHNRGDGTFEDVSWKAGANPIGWFWGSAFADFDNDGWLDLYSADGWVYNDRGTEIELQFLDNVVGRQDLYKSGVFFDPRHFGRLSWHGWERNRHLRNRGDGSFEEIGRPAGTDVLTNSRGVAVADFWNRGALDLAIAASDDRHVLLRNEVGTRRHWLQVELVGRRSNRNAVGARVYVEAGGRRQMREVGLGDGYASQSSLRQHFGLGGAAIADEVTVVWPASKTTQRFHNVAADRIVEVTEGVDGLVEKHYGAAGGPKG